MEWCRSKLHLEVIAATLCSLFPPSAHEGEDKVMSSEGETIVENVGMPNAHVAAVVMALIVLCLLIYFVYRCCRNRFCPVTNLMSIDPRNDSDSGVLDKEKQKQRELYLSIYGKKNKDDDQDRPQTEFERSVPTNTELQKSVVRF